MTHVKQYTIIKIFDANKRNTFREAFSYQLIVEKSKLLAYSINALPKFKSYRVESAADCSPGWNLEPRQIREMFVLSYLAQMLPEGVLSLTATTIPVLTGIDDEIVMAAETHPEIVNSGCPGSKSMTNTSECFISS
ncbi:hypothetical protein ILUMI_17998 [Ignelater luminosus]|uniref:Uncharacterized protein n=1 Tax=Ignelater luminosus TaxID=2038154 RepID=A0A8K0CNH7_IGNLU|nr:hypothetical protein ILUMI_17998 [Ignelater luminosus]